jgi:hypothetical protein
MVVSIPPQGYFSILRGRLVDLDLDTCVRFSLLYVRLGRVFGVENHPGRGRGVWEERQVVTTSELVSDRVLLLPV